MAENSFLAVIYPKDAGLYWDTSNGSITYGFPSSWPFTHPLWAKVGNVGFLSQAQQEAVNNILYSVIPTFANITFTIDTVNPLSAQIQFWNGIYLPQQSLIGFTDGIRDLNGRVEREWAFIKPNLAATSALPGSYQYSVWMHEILHTLGAKHPDPGGSGSVAPYLPGDETFYRYTIMRSGVHPSEPRFNGVRVEPVTPMLYDVAALQYLYGANMSTGSADGDRYSFSNTTPEMRTIWDAGGKNDFLSASNQLVGVKIDSRRNPGRTTSSGCFINRKGH